MSFLAIFVFIPAIVTGSLMSYWFSSTPSIGASGAIFGLVCVSFHLLSHTALKIFLIFAIQRSCVLNHIVLHNSLGTQYYYELATLLTALPFLLCFMFS
jgi:hypothetical protein